MKPRHPHPPEPAGSLSFLKRWGGYLLVIAVLAGLASLVMNFLPEKLDEWSKQEAGLEQLSTYAERWPVIRRLIGAVAFLAASVLFYHHYLLPFEALVRMINRVREFDPALFRILRAADLETVPAGAEDAAHLQKLLDEIVAFAHAPGSAADAAAQPFRWTFVVGGNPLQQILAADRPGKSSLSLLTALRDAEAGPLARLLEPFGPRSARPWAVAWISPKERKKISEWRPRRPMLLILEDPGAGQIDDVLDALVEASARFRCPVRLLILVPEIPVSIRLSRDHEGNWSCSRAGAEFAPPLGELVLAAEGGARAHVKPVDLRYQSLGALFMGRDTFLEALHRRLAARVPTRGGSLAIEVLRGMGGLGKTRLAVEYAWRYRADYSALLFVDAESPEVLRRSLASLAGTLMLPEAALADDALRLNAVRRWLNAAPGWLTIFDNVDTPDALAEVNAELGKLSGGVVLLTSRLSRFPDEMHENAVELLESQDAARYLLSATEGSTPGTGRPRAADDAEVALRLAETLGRLALALVHAAAYVKVERLTLRAYEERVSANIGIVLAFSDETLTHYRNSLAVTMRLSVSRLQEGQALLERVAWLAPERIPEALLDVAIPGAESTDTRKALSDLARYSLATREGDAGAPAFSVHRLVQALARENLDRERLQLRLGEAVKWLAEAMKPVGSAFRGQTSELVPHILSVLHYLRSDAGRDSDTAEFVDPLARLVVFAVLQTRVAAAASKPSGRLIVPEYLISILGSFYEVEPLSGAIDLLLENHPREWPAWQTQLLEADNYVLRYAMAESLAAACVRQPPAAAVSDVVALVEHPRNLNEFELGGYAASMIFAERPELIGRPRMEEIGNLLADRDEYSGRSILGDLLLNLVFRSDTEAFRDLRGLVGRERFWKPLWDYLKLDIAAFEAAEAFLAVPRRPPSASTTTEAAESFRNLEMIEAEITRLRTLVGADAALCGLLDGYFELPLKTARIRDAEAALAGRADLADFIRLLFRHPIWAVGEAGATVLSTLIIKDERYAAIVPQLLSDPQWRVRYGAIEAAFALRHQNADLFLTAVRGRYSDPNPKLAGLLAENLVSMILNAGPGGRQRLLGECEAPIRAWLKAEDCWVLEHVYRLFRALDLRQVDISPWLASGASRLFEGAPTWYRLPREAFLQHIEARKRVLAGAEAGTGAGATAPAPH